MRPDYYLGSYSGNYQCGLSGYYPVSSLLGMLSDIVIALRTKRGWSQAELAKYAKVSQQLITKIETGKVSESRKLPQIAAAFGLSVEQFLNWSGTTEYDSAASVMEGVRESKVIPFDRSKFVDIPRFEVQGSMGPGIPLPDMETIVSGIRVSAAWIRTELHNVSAPNNLAIITGYGDSMEGTYRDGAQLIVDRGVKDVKVDAIYVLSMNDELYIKRLQRRPDGSILMISDNTKYPPYVVENGERNKFAVLGRVVGAWNFSKI